MIQALMMASSGAPDLSDAWHGEFSAQMQPEWDRIIRVGPTRPLKTVAAGAAAAYQSPFAKRGVPVGLDHLATGVRTGFARTLIALDPGTYELGGEIYGVQIGHGIDLIGNGETRDDVVVVSTTPTRYTVHPWCNFYLANLTIIGNETTTPVQNNNYPLHASDVGANGQRDFTGVLDNVRVVDNRITSGIFGWDMPEGMRAFIYRSRFESTTGHGIVLHGGVHSDVDTLFLECEADVPMTVAPGSGGGTTIGKTWVVDCTKLDGTPIPNSAVIDTVPSAAPTGIPTTLPVGGMTESERAKFTPSDLGTAVEHVPEYPSLTNLSGFTPGRTYYVPLTMPAVAKIGSTALNVVTPAGTVSAGLMIGKEPGIWTWAHGIYAYDAAPAVTGQNVTMVPAEDSEFYLPAKTRVFLAVRVNSASCVVRASTTMSTATQCYYTDDVTTPTTGGVLPFPGDATPLPPGTPVPWVALVTAA